MKVLQVIEMLNEAEISLYIKNYNLETLNSNGTINPMSQFMVQILNSVNEMERKTIVMRLRSGVIQPLEVKGLEWAVKLRFKLNQMINF